MMPGILDGVRVLELAERVAAPYCARLLGDFGADVVKVESPAGDPARQVGPFPGGVADPEQSGLFLYVNASKRGIVMELDKPDDRELFRDLLGQADVFVTDRSTASLAAWGLDLDELRRSFPRLVIASVTPFGRTGPHADYKGYNLTVAHSGGETSVLPIGTETLDRPPVQAGRRAADYDTGINAAMAVLAALTGRLEHGNGELIDVSGQESELTLSRVIMGRYTLPTQFLESRATRFRRLGNMIRCADGYVEIMPLGQERWENTVKALGSPAWSADERFATDAGRRAHVIELNGCFEEWAAHLTKAEIVQRMQSHRVPAGMVKDAAEVFHTEQYAVTGFFQQLTHAVAGTLAYPTVPYRFPEAPAGLSRPAPLLGEHTRDVLIEWLDQNDSSKGGSRGAGSA